MANSSNASADSIVQERLEKARAKAPKPLDGWQEEELARCRADMVYWVNTYCWTFDPRPLPPASNHLRFELYDYQVTYLRWLQDRYNLGQDALTEKSRDMGATWINLAFGLHHWLFDASFQGLLGSRKEDLVDSTDNPDTLFVKLVYMLDRLPDWMRPAGYNGDRHRSFMRLFNPVSGNLITGESANKAFSRQGRYSWIFMDEFAFWEWSRSAWTASRDASHMRSCISTPEGANFFKELRFSGRIAVFTLHWRKHPKKTQAWYDAEKAVRTTEDIAQELDISYDKSVRGRVYPEWGAVPHGDYPHVNGWPEFNSWDFGIGDDTAIIWWQRNPRNGLYRVVDYYSNNDKAIDFYVPFCTGVLKSGIPYDYSELDIAKVEEHRGWGGAIHYGDPAGNQRNVASGTSAIQELRKAGIHVQTKPEVNTFPARWQTTKLFLRRIEGVNDANCIELDDAMTNARFPERPETSQSTSAITLPIHDWTSHGRTALEYFAVNVPANVDKAPPIQRERSAWEGM